MTRQALGGHSIEKGTLDVAGTLMAEALGTN